MRHFALLLSLSIAPAAAAQQQADPKLTRDPTLEVGKLANGLTYLVRENHKPEARAELRLAVNAGAVLENDDERGLAHFLEHMVFNGTEHFPPGELVKFLESIGLRFGADLNAYTGFDETVFILPVPTDKPELFEKSFQALSDLARRAALKPEEVDKERGVVMDEWRRGRDADARMRDKQLPILFQGSRYAERLPIGLPEIIEKAPPERLRGFYDRWYQPDNLAVIAVGDFKAADVKKLIEKEFGDLNAPAKPTVRPSFPFPDHDQTLYALASDKEATQTIVQVAFKSKRQPYATEGDYRRDLVTQFVSAMLSTRFEEIARKKDPPFLFASAQGGEATRELQLFGVFAATQDGKAEAGLEALLLELKRVRSHGFTQGELDRVKAELLAFVEREYQERDKTESASFVSDYLAYFLEGRMPIGIEQEWPIAQRLIPSITIDEVNQRLASLTPAKSRVILANMPEKEGVPLATRESFEAVQKRVEAADVTAYEDRVAQKPLVGELPKAGTVAKSERYEPLDAEVLTLSNGMTIWVKKTDFKNDQILVYGYAYGGLAVAKPDDFTSAQAAGAIVGEAGVGGFDPTDLQKLLAGKMVSVTPYIGSYQHGVSLSSTPKDLETAMQLLHLYFTAPNRDATAFANWQRKVEAEIVNKAQSPEATYFDRVVSVNRGGHYSAEPWTMERLKRADLDKALDFYRARFANAADFTLFFAGNVTAETLKPLLEKYLACLPSTGARVADVKTMGVSFPKGVVKEEVRKGSEPKAMTQISWPALTGMADLPTFRLRKACEVLQMRLLDILREQLGKTYGVTVRHNSESPGTEWMATEVSFGSAPENVNAMVDRILEEVDKFKKEGPTEKELAAVKEQEIRGEEVNVKQNRFWGSMMMTYHALKRDLKTINERRKRSESLTAEDVKAIAGQYFPKDNYTVVTLIPEAKG